MIHNPIYFFCGCNSGPGQHLPLKSKHEAGDGGTSQTERCLCVVFICLGLPGCYR